MVLTDSAVLPVLVTVYHVMMSVVLNRPQVLNCLNIEMIRMIQDAMDRSRDDDNIKFVLLSGAGERGFCSGGDLKFFTKAMQENVPFLVDRFLKEEYALDLCIHRFSKPVIVLADGITMGGGLGLAAGADIVLATEQTRMAMPETHIGFFPDVGATGWLFHKCPKGYPEYLTLTGYEIKGSECVRLGLATNLVYSDRVPEITALLEHYSGMLSFQKEEAVAQLISLLSPFLDEDIPSRPDMDEWVAEHFAGKTSLREILSSLSHCSMEIKVCENVFRTLAECSPTSLALTFALLRHNEGKPLEQVFASDLKAARFMIRHPDCYEGVRARIIDKDNKPRWKPGRIEEGGELDLAI
jgi:enoyl-CoA hydratase/carnithine racemase